MIKCDPVPKNSISKRIVDFASFVRTSKIRKRIPKSIKRLSLLFLPKERLELRTLELGYKNMIKNVKAIPPKISLKLGIIKDSMYRFGNYEAACLELGIPYKLIDITGDSWIHEITSSGCDSFLVWPSCYNMINKQVFDERLWIIVNELKKTIFPSYESLWIYESKIRTRDWLVANNIPHPSTHIFFNKEKAFDFLELAELPLVFKTDLGSEATGVEIVRNKKRARYLVSLCFGAGYVRKNCISKDRFKGYILFQEYVPDAAEWRMIRIGNSFLGHKKGKKGDFHSGTKIMIWEEPPRKLLEFCRDITEKGSFMSMDLDILETKDGRYLVNELQAVFGSKEPAQMYINGKPGRYIYNKSLDTWQFEEGYFCRNACCNLRVKTVLRLLGKPLGDE